MAKNKWMTKLLKLDGAVDPENTINPFSDVIRTPSPSFNFIFGGNWGLPRGYTMLMWGPEKAGKTLVSNAIIGNLHKEDPEAIAIKFDTELRESVQNPPSARRAWGIDEDRYLCFSVNEPDLVFDRIEKDIAAQIDEGAPIKLVIIDSISGIQGRRGMNADSVMTQQIGDNAATIQDGLKRILPIIRRKRIALILTSHIKAEMDIREIQRGKKYRLGGGHSLKHFAEYFVFIEKNQSKEGKSSLDGKEFVDDSVKDLMDHGDKIGHKIRVKVDDSSFGPKGRVGEFTIDYRKGIINTYEEIFLLGVNRGVIETPNQVTYVYGGEKHHGKQAMLAAIKNSPDLQKKILEELRLKDLRNEFGSGSETPPETSPVEESPA